MIHHILKAAILPAAVVASLALPAAADVQITITSEGDDDFFNRCDLEAAPTAGRTASIITYFVDVGEKGRELCQQTQDSRSCRGSDDLEYTCGDVQAIEVVGVVCRDNGVPVPCGTVSAATGPNVPVPVSVAPNAGGSDRALTIYATLLGYDDFFEHCEIGISYGGDQGIDELSVKQEIETTKGFGSCTTTLSGSGGTGRSCSGLDEHTCADVVAVRLTEIECERNETAIDCGPVTVVPVGGAPITE